MSAHPAPFPPNVRAKAPGHIPLADDQIRHLLRRTTYGPTPDLLNDVQKHGAAHWLDLQLMPGQIPDATVSAAAKAFPLTRMTSAQLRQWLIANGRQYGWDAMTQVQASTVMRAVVSKRQLNEVMTEFWSNHFNVTCPSGPVWTTRHTYDTMIRTNALGRFSDLLVNVVKSPAMQYYLSNNSSVARNPNENLGRELLELHTVGIDGGYDETDVHQSALALTGWTVSNDGTDTFILNPKTRYTGALQVMGWSAPASPAAAGIDVGTSYLQYLAHHPSTAYHLAVKLARRFVSDTPTVRLVNQLAKVYLANDTAIKPVLQALFHHHDFWASTGQKIQRPYERAVATMRSLGYKHVPGSGADWTALVWHLNQLGQAPLAWGPPNGYPDTAASWVSTQTTVGQWNSAIALSGGWWAGGHHGVGMTKLTAHNLLGAHASSSVTGGQLVDGVSNHLFGQTLAGPARAAILHWFGVKAGDKLQSWQTQPDRLSLLCSMILSNPVGGLR